MVATVQKYLYLSIKTPKAIMASGASSVRPTGFVDIDSTRGLTLPVDHNYANNMLSCVGVAAKKFF